MLKPKEPLRDKLDGRVFMGFVSELPSVITLGTLVLHKNLKEVGCSRSQSFGATGCRHPSRQCQN